MTNEPEPEAVEDAGGDDEQPSRIAGVLVVLVLGAVGVMVLKAVVTAAPYVAYFVAGVLVTVGVQKARAWWGRRGTGDSDGEASGEAEQPDVGEALRRLVGDDKGVLLTTLRDDLKLPSTKAVKELLRAEGIPWKAGRTREGNGPSVRREAIPPAPTPPIADPHGGGCCCRSGDNDNSNSVPPPSPEEGSRVRHIRSAAALYNPNDNVRRHQASK
ncbi:hypothetical protein [Streptomyces nigra]|uniref:hypothetical protein n=1 Tax=Streptomyces nigra TaxID=1827580 RepID=UPI0036407D4E